MMASNGGGEAGPERRPSTGTTGPARRLFERLLLPVANETDTAATSAAVRPYVDPRRDRLVVVHVIKRNPGYPDPLSPAAARERAEAIDRIARDRFADSGNPVETAVRYGPDVVREIVDVAAERDATAIGFHPQGGRRWVRRLTGDVGNRLLMTSRQPIVVFPPAPSDRRRIQPGEGPPDRRRFERVVLPVASRQDADTTCRTVLPYLGDDVRVLAGRSGTRPDGGRDRASTPRPGEDADRCLDLMAFYEHPPADRQVRGIERPAHGDVTGTVLEEVEQGYDLLVIGAADREQRSLAEPLFSTDVDDIIQGAPCPVMVVTAGLDDDNQPTVADESDLDRILLPTVGTEYSRHAAEIAFTIARNRDALVEVVHVVSHPGDVTAPTGEGTVEIGQKIVDREADLGREFGAEVRTRVLVSDREPETEILELAAENDDDLIILGSNLRPLSGRAFFGHRVEHVVKHADRPVAVLTSI